MPGVKVVHDGDFVGVVAPDAYTAQQALAAIKAKWNVPAAAFERRPVRIPARTIPNPASDSAPQHVSGSVADAFASADIKLDDRYTVAYIAHAPLEPRAAVAEWTDGKLTVWTGTQRPFGVRDELTQAFHLPASQVRVIVPDMGSGYGGKHTGEAAVEAARLAKAAGKPVKLVWTREEEFTWAYFRPAGVIEIKAGAQARRHADRLGVPQLQLRPRRHRHAVRRAQPAHPVPPVEVAAAPGLLPRPGLDGQPLRPRVAHGRAGPRRSAWTRSPSA